MTQSTCDQGGGGCGAYASVDTAGMGPVKNPVLGSLPGRLNR